MHYVLDAIPCIDPTNMDTLEVYAFYPRELYERVF